MSGHGWVMPNKDGSKARCGGPALCKQCAAELQQVRAAGGGYQPIEQLGVRGDPPHQGSAGKRR